MAGRAKAQKPHGPARKGGQRQLSLYLSEEGDPEHEAILAEFNRQNRRRRGCGQNLLRHLLTLGWRASQEGAGPLEARPVAAQRAILEPEERPPPPVAETPPVPRAPPPRSGGPRIGKLFD